MDMNAAVAKALQARRAALDMSQKELAEKSGIPYVTVNRLLKDERPINVVNLKLLSDALSISMSDLIDDAYSIIRRDETASAVEDIIEQLQAGVSPAELGLAASADPRKEAESETPYE